MTRPAVALVGAVLMTLPVATAEGQSASRVVDRTFICSTAATGSGRDVDVAAFPHTVYPDSFGGPDEVIAAQLEVSSGADSLDSDLVSVRARRVVGIGARVRPAGVYAHASRCRATRTPVPLSAKGLPGPPVQWYKSVSCTIPGRVLVHVRAVLGRAARWERAGVYEGAEATVVQAKIAVRAAGTRKPLAYLELTGGKKTRFWYSGGCT